MSRLAPKLHRRIGLVIAAVVLANSAIFGLVAVGIAYGVEDHQFVSALTDEAARQRAEWARTGKLAKPNRDYIVVYRRIADVPRDLREQLQQEGEQIEFRGDNGRHYHIFRFRLSDSDPASSAIAVAEVSRYLFVRPVLGPLLVFLVLLGAAIALLTGFIGFILARNALAPLTKLASQVDGAERDIPVIDPSAYPANEIGVLAGKLSVAFERIGSFVAREQAFTRDASHELRTPIAVIRGSAEIVALDADLSHDSRKALARIDSASQDMVRTLDLLLGLAREKPTQQREEIVLRPIVEQVIADVRQRFPDRVIKTRINIDHSATVQSRPTLLKLLLGNLIANSFAHSGAELLVVSYNGNELSILDNGRGMLNPAVSPTLSKEPAFSGGSGFGLKIVARLCEIDEIGFSIRGTSASSGTEIVLKLQR